MKSVLIIVAVCWSSFVFGQSKTTEKLMEKYSGSFSLYFYQNTLRMINQKEDKEFDELIKDIEKMRLLIIKKTDYNDDYKKLKGEYLHDSFEEVMTSRHEGKSFDIFVRESNGETKGMLAMVNGDENVFILDILGSIPFEKVGSLYSFMDDSSEVGDRIQRFIGVDEEAHAEGQEEHPQNQTK